MRTLSRGARVDRTDRSIHLHYAALAAHEVEDRVTTPETTLAQCLRRLPFDEACKIV